MSELYDFVKYDIKWKIKDNFGYKNACNGKIIFFDIEYGILFCENYYLLIDKTGKEVFNDRFEDLKAIGNDKFIYQTGEEYGVIEKGCKKVLVSNDNLSSRLKENNPKVSLNLGNAGSFKITCMDAGTFICSALYSKDKFLINKDAVILFDWSCDDDFIIKNGLIAIKRGNTCMLKNMKGNVLKKINLNFAFYLDYLNDNCIVIQNKKTSAYYKIDIKNMKLSKLKLAKTSDIIMSEDNFVAQDVHDNNTIYDSNFNFLDSGISGSVEIVANGYYVLEKFSSLKNSFVSQIVSLDNLTVYKPGSISWDNPVVYEDDGVSCDTSFSEDMIVINKSASAVLFNTSDELGYALENANVISDFVGGLAVACDISDEMAGSNNKYLIDKEGKKILGNYREIVLGKKYVILDNLIIHRDKIGLLKSDLAYDYCLGILTSDGTYFEKKFDNMDNLLDYEEKVRDDITKIIFEYEKEKEVLERKAKMRQRKLISNLKND